MQVHDTRVIQRHGQHQVHAQRFEIMFKDGSTVGLHPVAAQGCPQTFLRALHYEGLRWIVFDLRQLSADMEADILRLQPRDTPGVIFYTLRHRYPTAGAFCAAVLLQQPLASWWHHETEASVAAVAAVAPVAA
jgi:hypothetical protein